MTTKEKQVNILAVYHAHRPAIQALQEHYLAKAGRGGHCQCLRSHTVLPDGETRMPVDMTVHPNDTTHTVADFLRGIYLVVDEETGEQSEDWLYSEEEACTPFQELFAAVSFNVSSGPEGKNWYIVLEYEDETGHWRYSEDKDGNVFEEWHIVVEALEV